MQGSLLGLGFERVRGKRIGGEQVERQFTPAAGPRRNAGEQLASQLRQMLGKRKARCMHRAAEPLPQGCRWCGAAGIQPSQHFLARHRAKSRTISAVRARASPSFARSPTPAEAKCGRPPPVPPVALAIAFAMSPALTPLETRSSVTATWIPARCPVVNNTEIAHLCFPRNPSILAPAALRSSP